MIERYRMIIEGMGCEYRNLNKCSYFMVEMVKQLQVHEMGRIQVETNQNGVGPKVSIGIVFRESGMLLHADPGQGYAALDVFSLKPFDKTIIRNIFTEFFGTGDIVEFVKK